MAKDEEKPRDVAQDALENLVGQFSSKFDCFRELVQNSIDAGSQLIEVWTEFESDGRGAGTATLHVDDDGEGMDRAIIDGQLTKLFSSQKEGDLTKIGKFGIGFVSIFALEPSAVLLHTGKGGEYWELLFHEDRSFQLKALDSPLEGTRLSMFLKTTDAGYHELVEEVRATLSHWCAHSETDITFEDRADGGAPIEEINRPFSVEGALSVRYEVPGTEIVAAYSSKPRYGFYNRGLALYLGDDALGALGERADRYAHISFKIKSRYLEHTLSRETVVKDSHYDKAMELLDSVSNGQLFDLLIKTLEELADKERSVSEDELHKKYCSFLVQETAESFRKIHSRMLLLAHHHAALSPEQALEAVGYAGADPQVMYACEESSPVTEEASQWVTTFVSRPNSEDPRGQLLQKCLSSVHEEMQGGVLRRLLLGKKHLAPYRLVDPADAFFVVDIVQGSRLQQQVFTLTLAYLRRLGLENVELSWVARRKGSPRASPPELCVFRTEEVVEPIEQGPSLSGKKVAVFERHPFVQKLILLAKARPEQAAFLLTQRLLLSNLSDEPTALALVEVLNPEICHG